MDPNTTAMMQALFRDSGAMRQLIDETTQAAQSAAPGIAVPVRDVPAPVELRGEVKLYIVFPYESIAGKTLGEIEQRVRDTLQGERSPWLPQIVLGDIALWQERQVGPATAANLRESGGVSSVHRRDDGEDVGHPDPGAGGWPQDPAVE